jgi:hypothetical protein
VAASGGALKSLSGPDHGPGPCPLATWFVTSSGSTPLAAFDTTLTDGIFYWARIELDRTAGTMMGRMDGTVGSLDLQVRDMFELESADGEPVTFRVQALVNLVEQDRCFPPAHCEVSVAHVDLIHGPDLVRTVRGVSSQVLELRLTKAHREPFEIRMDGSVGLSAQSGIWGRFQSSLQFLDLPPGSRVTSCHGFVADAPTHVLVSLAGSEVAHDGVTIHWQVSDPGLVALIHRRSSGTDLWEALTSVVASGTGRISFEDRAVIPGAHYSYRLGFPNEHGDDIHAGEVSFHIPAAPALRLRLAGSNPARITDEVEVQLGSRGSAQLAAFDVAGRRMGHRQIDTAAIGSSTRFRLSDLGLALPGLYVLRLQQAEVESTLRVMLVH